MSSFLSYIDNHITKKYTNKNDAFNDFTKTFREFSRFLSDAEDVINPLYKAYNGPAIEDDDTFFEFLFSDPYKKLSYDDVPRVNLYNKNDTIVSTIMLDDWKGYSDSGQVKSIIDDPEEEDDNDDNNYSYEDDFHNHLTADLKWYLDSYSQSNLTVCLFHPDGTLRYTYNAVLAARTHNSIIKFTYASRQSRPYVLFELVFGRNGERILNIKPDNEVSSVYIQDETNSSQYPRNPIDV
jgi:hypothetical protein